MMEKLKQMVKKSLILIKEEMENWNKTCDECQPLLSAIFNSVQQICCCKRAKLEETSLLNNFPDIKESLYVKLTLNSERAFTNLSDKILVLQKCCEKLRHITSELHTAMKPVMHCKELYEATATLPAFVDIVLWINEISFLMNTCYAEKLALREIVCNTFLNLNVDLMFKSLTSAQQMWSKNKDLEVHFHELMQYCFTLLPCN